MRTIEINDRDAKLIDALCMKFGLTVEDVITRLTDVVRDEIVLDEWFSGIPNDSIEGWCWQ